MDQINQIDPQLWNDFTHAVTKQRKKPITVLTKFIREYLEMYEDKKLFAEMRRDLRGRAMSDEEVVELVHQYRREKRAARIGKK
ncbi:MAG: hypothetical protein HZC40_03200 [Chloroflexi bacterium]|nr:hypothetical protein [Chloroflexota bacterium]